jgi:LmbE family N-acetylglucosaminyl deacetylase
MAVVAQPRIHGEGTAETAWRGSPWLAGLPQRPLDALLGDARRLVVVSPHPDDEVLGCGGLMAHACQRGLHVRVVAVTDGEACYPGDAYWTPQRLRAVRRSERQAALGELGVDASVLALGIADGAVGAEQARLQRSLADLLRAGDCVLTTWRADGHPDHEATASAVLAAAAVHGLPVIEFPVWAWHWLPVDGNGAPQGAARYALADGLWQAKQRALACFASQLGSSQPAMAGPILPPHVLARFQRRFEVFSA